MSRSHGYPRFALIGMVFFLVACTTARLPNTAPSPAPAPTIATTAAATATPTETINLDAETQRLIAGASRVAFVIPFSHWDTNWHDNYAAYSEQADHNIATAITIAQQYPRFRYTLEQVTFVQHFWTTHPEQREALRALVRSRQFTFASGGLTQQDTSLTAPTVQWNNWQLGQAWLRETFGVESQTAWQSDAFGNSAALPIMLNQLGISALYMGRIGTICEQRPCTNPLPHAFRWQSPADPTHQVLATYMTYSDALHAVRDKANEEEQRRALRAIVDREAARTTSKYLFIPLGDDFADPNAALPGFVEGWNAADRDTILVEADPETAFRYLDTQSLPTIVADRNPLWQGFYGSRPAGKIADKESEYFLTAADKFGVPLGESAPAAWEIAAFNGSHDGIAGTSFDRIWEQAQRPSFVQAVADGATTLTSRIGRIASGVDAPVVIFNPTSWTRAEVVELQGPLPDLRTLPAPVQQLGPDHIAFKVDQIPANGWLALAGGTATVTHPTTTTRADQRVTLGNGLVTLTIDGARGGTISSLRTDGGPELLAGPGDDLADVADMGDVYGASFGAERARQSNGVAQINVLAEGPLLARVEITCTIGGVPVVKTITLKADSPLVEVTARLAALPETTALVQVPTTRATTSRTDDLGFGAFTHQLDNRPITPGTITYRRVVFYPTIGWSDVSADGAGLTLITHGLQGLAGTDTLSMMLVRQVSDGGGDDAEGVTDGKPHLFRYAYLPHVGTAADAQPWLAAYTFNQPLIPVWRTGGTLQIQLPFADDPTPRQMPIEPGARPFPPRFSLLAAESGLVADLTCQGGQLVALVIDYDPQTPTVLTGGTTTTTLPQAAVATRVVQSGGGSCRAGP